MVLADTYEKTQQYILEMPKFTKKNSLDDTRLFLEILGSPEKDKKIIHVAGTNGKGSVCAYLCSVLTKAGYRTGMFTSPHLVEMRERFRIGKTLITEERFLQGFLMVMGRLEEMREKSGKTEYHPTFFELLFLMGMVIFREEKVEYIVLETGLGGRLDATNAVQTPVLTAITSIGYDHMEYLDQIDLEELGDAASEEFVALHGTLTGLIGPELAKTAYDEGYQSYRQGQFAEAIPNLAKAYQYDETNGDALFYLANSYRETGNLEKAREAYAQVIELFPGTLKASNSEGYLAQMNNGGN